MAGKQRHGRITEAERAMQRLSDEVWENVREIVECYAELNLNV